MVSTLNENKHLPFGICTIHQYTNVPIATGIHWTNPAEWSDAFMYFHLFMTVRICEIPVDLLSGMTSGHILFLAATYMRSQV